jgi:hypothetical protein
MVFLPLHCSACSCLLCFDNLSACLGGVDCCAVPTIQAAVTQHSVMPTRGDTAVSPREPYRAGVPCLIWTIPLSSSLLCAPFSAVLFCLFFAWTLVEQSPREVTGCASAASACCLQLCSAALPEAAPQRR